MRLFVIALLIESLLLAHAHDARADGAASAPVLVDFVPDDPAASLVVTRFVPVGRHWEGGPIVGGFSMRETLCVGPCVREIDPAWALHVAGSTQQASTMFLLSAGEKRVELRARVGDGFWRDFGGVFMYSGAVAFAMGAGFMGVHLLGRPIEADSAFRTTALLSAGIGVVFLAIGAPFYFANATTVTTTTGRKLALVPGGFVF
jgi:hypothetical protein